MKKIWIGCCLVLLLSLCACGNENAEWQAARITQMEQYIQSVADAVYHNESEAYCELSGSTLAEAQELRKPWIEYIENRMMYYLKIEESELDHLQKTELNKLCNELSNQMVSRLNQVNYDEKNGYYEAVFTISCIHLEESLNTIAKTCLEESYAQLALQDPATVTSEAYVSARKYYVKSVIDNVSTQIDQIGQNEEKEVILRVTDADGDVSIATSEWRMLEKAMLSEE